MSRFKVSKEIINKFKEYSTSNLSDALDRLGIYGGCHGIKPVISGRKMVGSAFTLRYIPCGLKKGTVGDYIDDVEPGEIVVIDNAGRTCCTVWGDLLTLTAKQRGVAGTLIDGVCRDLDAIKMFDYSIFSRGYYMVTGKERVQVNSYNIPVSISGVQVRPGDIVIGDDSGVVVVPYERAEELLQVAAEILEAERYIEEAVKKGSSLREARNKFNYHSLQSKSKNGS